VYWRFDVEDAPQKLEMFYEGKAKKLYSTPDPNLVIAHFKDDATAFNAKKKGTIEDKGVISPSDAVISMNLAEQTRKVLATLTPREEKVLRMRFGIGEKSDHTLEEVGQDFEVTRERIRQIEAKALRKLRHPSRSRKLRDFLEA